ncbi:MAG: rRNA maturation RNase YbeY [Porphyromonadaceae bacterium]|nr:rRNA maturation RNase YbeY [Porphyromonadaceae bacterium]
MITFYAEEGVRMPELRRRIVKAWLKTVALSYGKRIGTLCYQFCNDERILEVNKQFLNHDYYTDIITFDESWDDTLSGDMLISLDTVRSNAEMLGATLEEELHRVIVHGLLHLSGLRDKTKSEAKRMRSAEDEALGALRNLLPEGVSLLAKRYK